MTLDPNGNLLLFGLVSVRISRRPDVYAPWHGAWRYFATRLSSDGTHMLSSQTYSFVFYDVQTAMDSGGSVYLTGYAGPTQGVEADETLNAVMDSQPIGLNRVILAGFNVLNQALTYLGPIPDSMVCERAATVMPLAFAGDTGNLLLAGTLASSSSTSALVAADFSGERLPLATQARSSAWPGSFRVRPGVSIEIRGLGLGPADAVSYDPSGGVPMALAQTRNNSRACPADPERNRASGK